MALLEWRDEYLTGIRGVDYEHEDLIYRINAVYALIKESEDPELVVDGLGEIYGRIAAHFTLEEQMMLRYDYPDYAAHRDDHEHLLERLRATVDSWRKSLRFDRSAFEFDLRSWFEHHFGTHDARLHHSAGMREHDPVSDSAMRKMVDKQKADLVDRQE